MTDWKISSCLSQARFATSTAPNENWKRFNASSLVSKGKLLLADCLALHGVTRSVTQVLEKVLAVEPPPNWLTAPLSWSVAPNRP
jgi:hypothetical protein